MARICAIREHHFSSPRLRREITALAEAGHRVDVICTRHPGEPLHERRGAITVWRLPLRHGQGRRPAGYLAEYAAFFLLSASLMTVLHARKRFDLIQVNTLPDVLVFASIVPRLAGAKVLIDLQECMPEFYATKFRTSPRHPMVRLIGALEQRSIRYADAAITPTAQLREAFVRRGADGSKIEVVMDGSDESVFQPRSRRYPHRSGSFTVISHGTVEEHYGLDTLVEALGLLRNEIPELRLRIFGTGSYLGTLRDLVARLDLADRVSFSGDFVPIDELVDAIAEADLGVVAMKQDAFRDLTLAGKVFDFVVMRVPAVVSRTRSAERTFDEHCFEWFTSRDPADLARAILRLYRDPERRSQLVAHALQVSEPYRWTHQRHTYLRVVEDLIASQRPALRS